VRTLRSIQGFALTLVFLAASCTRGPKRLLAEEAWARTASLGSNSAVYFRIVNPGPSNLLYSAETEASIKVSIHLSSQGEERVARMILQESVEIPAGTSVSFQPGSLHLTLMDVWRPILAGDEIGITLLLEIADPKTLVAVVRDR
jgi:copper(I)-binding protein